jgi:hypothetical protein
MSEHKKTGFYYGEHGFGVVCADPDDDQARWRWASEVYRLWREAGWPSLIGPGAGEKKQAQAILGLDY